MDAHTSFGAFLFIVGWVFCPFELVAWPLGSQAEHAIFATLCRPDALRPVCAAVIFCVAENWAGGAQLLVLACDGVWDVCSNDDVYEIVKSIVSEGETSLKLICEEVLDQCLERNSKDNISAVLVAFPKLKKLHYKEGQGVMGRRRRKDDQEGGRDGGDFMDGDDRTDSK